MRRFIALLLPATLLLLPLASAADASPEDAGRNLSDDLPTTLHFNPAEVSLTGWWVAGSTPSTLHTVLDEGHVRITVKENMIHYTVRLLEQGDAAERAVAQARESFDDHLQPEGPNVVRYAIVTTVPVAPDHETVVEEEKPSKEALLVVEGPDGRVRVYVLERLPACLDEVAAPVASCARPDARRGERVKVQAARTAMPDESGLFWTAVLATVLAVAILGAAATPVLAGALFSRFDRDDVLDHPRRAELYDAVRADAGITFGVLRSRLGWSPGVLQHHLALLERHGLIRRRREGRSTRYVASGPRVALAALGAKARVLEELASPSTASALAERLGRRLQTTMEHLHALEVRGLVAVTNDGRIRRWHRLPA